MSSGLNIRPDGALDFLSLGALVHRLDPGVIPFRKATECAIHVSGGEFNTAANLADCFRLQTGIASAMVDYPPDRITGQRVVLRPPMLDDAGALFQRVARDPEVTKYLLWAPHSDVAATRRKESLWNAAGVSGRSMDQN